MSNEEHLSTEDEVRIEWRKRLYFKEDTLKKLRSVARKTVHTDEDMVVWIVEQYFDPTERKANENGQ
jgi:hypothetical protein